jgi:hypothetical protein
VLASALSASSKDIFISSGSNGDLPSLSSGLHGVDYTWGPLGIQCCAPSPSEAFPAIQSLGFNLIRVPISWNAYEQNSSAYIGYLNQVATEADSLGMYIVYDAHSCGGTNCEPGFFYPSSLRSQYSNNSAFFSAWWTQKVEYDGQPGWEALWDDFWMPVVQTVDSHSSTFGYELENEPFLFKSSILNFQQFNQYVASHVRSVSSKYIVFMAPGEGLNAAYDEEGAPTGITGLVLDAHCYISQSNCSDISSKLSALSTFQKNTGIPVWVGEWAVYSGCCISESQSESIVQEYVSLFKKYDFANTYWAWLCKSKVADNALLAPPSCSTFWLDTQISQAENQSSNTSTSTTSITSSTFSDTSNTSTSASISNTSRSSTTSFSSSSSPSNSSTSSTSISTSITTSTVTSALGLDGYVKNSVTSGMSSLSVTMSTTKSPDLVVVFAVSGSTRVTMGISDKDGLSWSLRKSVVDSSFGTVSEFYAIADGVLSSDSITVTQTKSDALNVVSFGIAGANTSSPFDSGSPSVALGYNSKPAVIVSTQDSNDMVIGLLGTSGEPGVSSGGGFTQIIVSRSLPSASAEYYIASSTQTIVYDTLSSSKYWAIMGDAIQAASSSSSQSPNMLPDVSTIFILIFFIMCLFWSFDRRDRYITKVVHRRTVD